MYKDLQQIVPTQKRAEINDKILYCIDTHNKAVTSEVVYNCYTGAGGLHNLSFNDFNNFHDYTEAKKEFEMGQFFTPHAVCQLMVEMAAPSQSDRVADFCCGMGNFFNWLPDGTYTYGSELDPKAVKVARFLYPDAHIECRDILYAAPEGKFDFVFGNPPFNLKWQVNNLPVLSQLYYCQKAAEYLNPGGLLLLVVPASFLADGFWNKSMISEINDRFNFIGQCKLESDTFGEYQVTIETKIMAFQRKSDHLENVAYSSAFVSLMDLRTRVAQARETKHELRLKLAREAKENSELPEFEYKLAKYMYEIRIQPSIKDKYGQCLAFVEKFRTQKPPENATEKEYKHWLQHVRISEKQVLNRLRKIVRGQNDIKTDRIALVRQSSGFAIKTYSSRMGKVLKELNVSPKLFLNIHDLLLWGDTVKSYFSPMAQTVIEGVDACEKVLSRKRKEMERQQQAFCDMLPSENMKVYVDKLTFKKADGTQYALTPLQKSDAIKLFSKRYSLVNWQQGCGKTVVSFLYGKMLLDNQKVRNVIVVAPAVATNLTWSEFLTVQGVAFRNINRKDEINTAQPGEFLILSTSMLGKRKRELRQFLRLTARKHCLIFDESDEISNAASKRTRHMLNLFRHLPYKMLCTGTTTRNDISEIYSQLSLLYNNSYNFISMSRYRYEQDEDGDFVPVDNEYLYRPLPVKQGNRIFRSLFSPGKKSVFGIRKNSQDIYNSDDLKKILDYTIITRRFKEVAGDKYEVINDQILPGVGEKAVYDKILNDFYEILPRYFQSTGDSRKDAALRLVRIIELLRRACSTAHLMPGYFGSEFPAKAGKIMGLVRESKGLVAVGCISLESLSFYTDLFKRFIDRPLFVIDGSVPFNRRKKIIAEFQQSGNGVLLSTQQSLSSSVNIPSCNEVIIETLQWNIPRMEQYYMRFIRFDSTDYKHVHFVTYADTIEQNILALVMCKEKLNEFIKSGSIHEDEEIFSEFGISADLFDNLMQKQYDEKGQLYLSWGEQKVV